MANYNLFDAASLAMIPTGVKEDKVYSIKPTDGSGDLAFSRSNDTATRVNSSGLIEKVRTNLVPYSEQFDNAGWTKTNLTITPNSTAAPDGSLTADTITDDATNGVHNVLVAGLWDTTQRTASVFAKAGTSSKVYIQNAVLGTGVFADLSTNTLVVTGSFTGTITNEGSGWFRITATHTAASPSSLTIGLFDGASTSVYAGTGSTAFIWGAQVETGDIATDYIATTSAAVSVGPVANLPRLDYSGGASCPKLLLEGQRTNTALYSEQADNAYWSKSLCTITANQGTAPDGTMSADLLTTSSTNCVIYRTSVVAGALSFFAKAATLSAGAKFYISVDGVGNAKWNQDGTISSQTGALVAATDGEDYGNGWYRFTFVVGSGSVLNYGLSDSTSGDTAFIWGMQNEASASYATSYIPTLLAASTRGADAAQNTSATALIGQTEGTIFWEVQIDTPVATANEALLNIDAGAFGNTIYIIKGGTGNIVGEMYVSNAAQASFIISGISAGNYKIAFAYAQNNTAMFVNGVQVGATDTSCSVPATSRIQLGNGVFGPSTDLTKQALLFKTRLTDAECIALTTI